MSKIKVLWFSNRIFEAKADSQSGTWLTTMGPELANSQEIELANISFGNVSEITKRDYQGIQQWILPGKVKLINGLPELNIIKGIQHICNTIKPDIIHIWGTEYYWGLLSARGYITGNIVLSIQGVMASILPVSYGGLSNMDKLKCLGLREIIYPSQSLYMIYHKLKKSIKFEMEKIVNHKFIITQSLWTQAQIRSINPDFTNFHTERILRSEFLKCDKWTDVHRNTSISPIVFTSCLITPYKGLHVLIRAIALLKKKFPGIRLEVAGYISTNKLKQTGYERWLRKLICECRVEECITFLGPQTVEMLTERLNHASVFVNPSYIESYSLTLAEAMAVGTPAVVSYTGAMPELLGFDETALYFTPGDYINCARQIEHFLVDFDFSCKASFRMQKIAEDRNNSKNIIHNQVTMYKQIQNNLY